VEPRPLCPLAPEQPTGERCEKVLAPTSPLFFTVSASSPVKKSQKKKAVISNPL
jgi:hypothetical protein